MNIEEMHASNERAWDEAAAHYETEIQADIEFLRAGGKNFCEPELAYLGDLAQWCGRAIHLQCAGGRDTLSLWNLGAQSVVGVDINARMLACATAKAQALGAPAEWVCSDILNTPRELDGTADLVYTGRGALCWLMDLDAWARVIARLLKPGGKLYVFDGHPMDWLWDGNSAHYQLYADDASYFQGAPVSSVGWPASYIPAETQAKQPAIKWERQWMLGEIVNALLAAGLRLLRLEEHPHRYWDIFPNMPPELQDRLPHTFSLWVQKPAG